MNSQGHASPLRLNRAPDQVRGVDPLSVRSDAKSTADVPGATRDPERQLRHTLNGGHA